MRSNEMIRRFYNSNCSSKLWVEFYSKYTRDEVSKEEWLKFSSTCSNWQYDYDKKAVTDILSGEIVEIYL